jgi:hypothetical protein
MPPHDSEERDDEVMVGATCPIQDCGVLVVAYRPPAFTGRDNADPSEFTCPRCGTDFTVPEGDLIFQSVPKARLFATVRG